MMQHIFVGTSVLFPVILAELNLNYAEFGVALAASSAVGGLFQIIFSTLSRKISRHVLLGCGNLLLSLGTFLTGITRNFVSFLNARTIANVGVAPQHPIGTAIISERFEGGSLGRALGIHYGLAYTGNIIGPLFMTFLVFVVGWRSTLFIFSIPALIVGLTVVWYLNEPRNPMHSSKTTDSTSLKSDIITLMKTKSISSIILAQALLSGGAELGVITTYTPLFLSDALNLGVYETGIVYTIGLVGGVIGPILFGRYSDKLGPVKTAILSLSIAVALVYLLSFYRSAHSIIIPHLFFLGFVSFALPTLLQSHLVKVTTGYRRDLVIALFFAVSFAFSSLWTGVVGYTIEMYSSFTPAFVLMGSLGFVAIITLVRSAK